MSTNFCAALIEITLKFLTIIPLYFTYSLSVAVVGKKLCGNSHRFKLERARECWERDLSFSTFIANFVLGLPDGRTNEKRSLKEPGSSSYDIHSSISDFFLPCHPSGPRLFPFRFSMCLSHVRYWYWRWLTSLATLFHICAASFMIDTKFLIDGEKQLDLCTNMMITSARIYTIDAENFWSVRIKLWRELENILSLLPNRKDGIGFTAANAYYSHKQKLKLHI